MATRRTASGNGPVRRRDSGDTATPVTRAEFEAASKQLTERDKLINELRHELNATCRDLTEEIRRELQTQFMRIVQIQREIDDLKRQTAA